MINKIKNSTKILVALSATFFGIAGYVIARGNYIRYPKVEAALLILTSISFIIFLVFLIRSPKRS
jgi:hypothetical protein